MMSVIESPLHLENLDRKKVNLISLISLALGFAQALLVYVMSSYFKLISGVENVSFFYLAAYAVTLLVLLQAHKIIRVIGKCNIFLMALMSKIAVLALLSIFPPSGLSIGLMMLFIVLTNLEWVSLDIILESFSSDKMSGRIRGKYLTILNMGILVGPFVSTRILGQFDFEGVFIAILMLNILIFIVSLVGLRRVTERFPFRLSVRELLAKVWKRKNILRIYAVACSMEFFYALMVIYTPIYLLDLGMSWDKIGLIFTAMLLPFVILQYPIGILADKKTGEKELMISALFIAAASTAAIFFIDSVNIWIWSIILFATRIGIALVEVLRDSYFYKRIDGQDVDIISFYRTSNSVGYIVALAISAIFLIFFPIRGIFLIVSIVLLLALYPAFRLEDNLCEAELSRKRLVRKQ